MFTDVKIIMAQLCALCSCCLLQPVCRTQAYMEMHISIPALGVAGLCPSNGAKPKGHLRARSHTEEPRGSGFQFLPGESVWAKRRIFPMRTQTQNALPGQQPLLGPGAGLGSLCPSAEQGLLPGTLLQLSRAS